MDDAQTRPTEDATPLDPNQAKAAHLAAWRFKPGEVPTVHRPKGAIGGRTLALQTLDNMMATAGNQKALREALQKEFNKRPVWFFLNVMLPTMPRELLIKATATEARVTWTSLLTQLQSPAGSPADAGPPTIDVEAVTVKAPMPPPADPPPTS